ncbi:hypothetical protein [Clostridium sp.]|uniref:hypothetical protein n=1 Tax=Clostridium sp. TaxID=1506 RepID=UPI002FC761A5
MKSMIVYPVFTKACDKIDSKRNLRGEEIMLKDKKAKNFIFIVIILVTAVEAYFGYKVYIDYVGIYQVGIFMPFILQPDVYKTLFIKEKVFYKLRIVIAVLISFILPVTIYFTLPNYTYIEGKLKVEQHFGQNKNISFNYYSMGKNSIPLSNNPKQLFVSNRAYYYEVASEEGIKYFFIVNPLTGELIQLSKRFW